MRAAAPESGPLRVLEAGCGQKWPIQLPGVELHIAGVDYDAEALRIRKERRQDLDEAVVGDLRTVELPAGHFDVAYCAFVLEHVEGAELVLDRLLASLRPGGRLVVLVPNARSVYGWAARSFPFWAAVAYKKYVEGFKDAGKPGHAPYPTVYEPVISLAGLRDWAVRRGAHGRGIRDRLRAGELRPVPRAGVRRHAGVRARRWPAADRDTQQSRIRLRESLITERPHVVTFRSWSPGTTANIRKGPPVAGAPI